MTFLWKGKAENRIKVRIWDFCPVRVSSQFYLNDAMGNYGSLKLFKGFSSQLASCQIEKNSVCLAG